MKRGLPLFTIALMLLMSLILFRSFQRRVADSMMTLAIHPEIRNLLDQGGADLKLLARLDPEHAPRYRDRFQRFLEARQNLEVLSRSRHQLASRYEAVLLGGLLLTLTLAALLHGWQRRQVVLRLGRLKKPLEELAAGKERVSVTEQGGDLFGQFARMIQQTAEVISHQRRKLNYLNHLKEWQETARRLGHELRTPLGTIRMEVERLPALAEKGGTACAVAIGQTAQSVLEEVDRLAVFARGFSSFAGMGQPRLKTVDLAVFLEHFAQLFGQAWPRLTLDLAEGPTPLWARIDKGMIRQVLTNLCNNSAAAMDGAPGTVIIRRQRLADRVFVDLHDDGPGLHETVKNRLFDPYVTTKPSGSGMGLGLAISRKIMLEHGGDLELVAGSAAGTCFRLLFPAHNKN